MVECERRRRRDSDLTASSMDPPSGIHETPPFSAERAPVYNLSEIWPFPLRSTGNVRSSDGNLDLKTSLFPFENPSSSTDRNPDDGGADDLMTADCAGSHDCATGKRRDELQNDNSSMKVNGKRAKTATGSKDEGSDKAAEQKLQNPVPTVAAKQDYIHVRARRGQATDSHSLAERARREKISERMKILQDLVPGCNKVVGKALVLDEIINYIQSLQRQVEFLSMKLEAVTSRMNLSIDGLHHSKNFEQQAFDDAGFGSQNARDYGRSSSPEWLHMQIGGRFERSS